MSRIAVRDVIGTVAAIYDLTPEEIRSPCRDGRIRGPRQIAYWLARRLTGQSLPAIGRVFDREHSAILYGVRRIDQARLADPALSDRLTLLEAAIRAGASAEPAGLPGPIVAGIDVAALARGVLAERGKVLGRLEGLVLARAYLDLAADRVPA